MTRNIDRQSQAQPQKIRADGIFRSPHFLSSDYGYQAAWLHAPDDLQVRGTILILPPFGLEYTHSHRTLLHLADRLAMSGFAALRIDYVGTGDSSGDESSISAADDWIQGAVVALQALSEAFPDSPPSIIGLRHGALLAAAAAAHVDVTDFVGWAPLDGSQGIRSDAGTPQVISHQEDGKPGDVEAESFRIPRDAAERIAEIDISKLEPRLRGRCLILSSSDRLSSRLWVQRMQQLGIASDDLKQSDFHAMMLEPRDSELPHQTLSTLTSWVSRTPATTAQFNEDAYLSYVRCMAPLNVQGWAERHVVIEAGDRSLVGVFSEPDHLEDVARVVLLPNSGSLNHISPNRLGVKLSRELAKVGVATLRFDLGELVTSRARRPDEQNDPNPETTLADVAACVTWVCDHRPDVSISIADLCSEDQTALRAAMDLPSSAIDHVVSINPLSGQIAGDAICHGRTVVDGTPWQRLDSGEPYVRSILKSLSQRVTVLTVSTLRYIEEVLGVQSDTILEDNLRKIIAQDRSIDLVFSAADPGRELLTRQAGRLVKQLQRDGELSMHVARQRGPHLLPEGGASSHRSGRCGANITQAYTDPAGRRWMESLGPGLDRPFSGYRRDFGLPGASMDQALAREPHRIGTRKRLDLAQLIREGGRGVRTHGVTREGRWTSSPTHIPQRLRRRARQAVSTTISWLSLPTVTLRMRVFRELSRTNDT